MPVRNPENQLVEDGYRFTVVSNETGARAVLEIPKSLYGVDYVQREAEKHLGAQDAVIQTFGLEPPK